MPHEKADDSGQSIPVTPMPMQVLTSQTVPIWRDLGTRAQEYDKVLQQCTHEFMPKSKVPKETVQPLYQWAEFHRWRIISWVSFRHAASTSDSNAREHLCHSHSCSLIFDQDIAIRFRDRHILPLRIQIDQYRARRHHGAQTKNNRLGNGISQSASKWYVEIA